MCTKVNTDPCSNYACVVKYIHSLVVNYIQTLAGERRLCCVQWSEAFRFMCGKVKSKAFRLMCSKAKHLDRCVVKPPMLCAVKQSIQIAVLIKNNFVETLQGSNSVSCALLHGLSISLSLPPSPSLSSVSVTLSLSLSLRHTAIYSWYIQVIGVCGAADVLGPPTTICVFILQYTLLNVSSY